ncbi:MAG: phosphotransferase [Fimbriimonadaceae bacterium]|nr:phosphotransferase [Fimbriimonadaceae bacterium]
MITVEEARTIAEQFAIEGPIDIVDFEGKGNINLDTMLITAGPDKQHYLLQKVNAEVFPMPDRVMAGMLASISQQVDAIDKGRVPSASAWKPVTLVRTRDHDHYISLTPAKTWRMMQFIEGTVSYKSLSEVPDHKRLTIAREVGRGLAIYTDLTAEVDASEIPVSLPGYRDTKIYFKQLHSALKGHRSLDDTEPILPPDPEVRAATERHFHCVLSEDDRLARRHDPELLPFIETALKYESLATSLQDLRESGAIRQTAIHGDTKIENFLFDQSTHEVVSLVDLDTVMPLTWLADWGDMVRSLCNVAGEKETDLSRIQVDREVYAAVRDGFLGAATTMPDNEIALMPRAVQAITLELGVRFLADYLRGDTYFRVAPTDPVDLNKTRAMVQIKLFEKLLEFEAETLAKPIANSHR